MKRNWQAVEEHDDLARILWGLMSKGIDMWPGKQEISYSEVNKITPIFAKLVFPTNERNKFFLRCVEGMLIISACDTNFIAIYAATSTDTAVFQKKNNDLLWKKVI